MWMMAPATRPIDSHRGGKFLYLQADNYLRAFTHAAIGMDRAFVGVHDGLRNREAQAKASGGSRTGGISAAKPLEYMR
jgi:hypothetical protein